jgi:DeoR/GlpR family transcriptional regulator of sugar metabolism
VKTGTLANASAEERRKWILDEVARQGHVGVRELAETTEVSEATVRRDLRHLADQGEIELVYGGATPVRDRDHSIQTRTTRNAREKRIAGRLAATLVKDGEMLFVDSGTTCFEMHEGLKQRRSLTVVLNSTRLAQELADSPELSLVFLGGHFRPDRMDTVGPLAANAIDQLRGYVAFFGADGLSPDFGVSANDIQTAYLYQHVIKNARESILVVDHTKFNAPSLFRIEGFEAISRIVTDQPPSAEWQKILAERGIELVTPDNDILNDNPKNHA